MTLTRTRSPVCWPLVGVTAVAIAGALLVAVPPGTARPAARSRYVVLGYNELGMHCMNQSFKELCILPPFNNLRAQVIDRSGEEPRIVTSGVTVRYSVPGNTRSSTKSDFWTYAQVLFGTRLAPDVGLTGNRLAGVMKPSGANDWIATGIPITPIDDKGQLNPYPLSRIDVVGPGGATLASTVAVVPVSWEISCNLCHNTPGISVETDILRKHDLKHGTKLEASKPVLCAKCHADNALGTTGTPGVKSLSHAMHGSHASRMAAVPQLTNSCYACHPGQKTNCQRDVHVTRGITCVNCHGDMTRVADPARRPWIDEPTCAGCHQKRKPTWQFEEPGKLFKESRGHHGVHCAACHGPQHATGPAVTAADNAQAILQQGSKGTIHTCSVCHTQVPDEPFSHRLGDGGEGGSGGGEGGDRERSRRAESAAVTRGETKRDDLLGSYDISGTSRTPDGERTLVERVTGKLVAVRANQVELTLVWPSGSQVRQTLPLAQALQPAVTAQTVAGAVRNGDQSTTASLTFRRTAAGLIVTGTTSTTGDDTVLGGRARGTVSFSGSR